MISSKLDKSLCRTAKPFTPSLIRLRAQNHRIFFRDQGDSLRIERVLDRKEAYR